MADDDLRLLGGIRLRRLENARADKSAKERALAEAQAKVAKMTDDLERLREETARKIEKAYQDLVALPECGIDDVDEVKLSESLLREQVAAMQAQLVEAQEEEGKAREDVREAANEVMRQVAANEALRLLNEEQQKETRRKVERGEEDVIDEVAEVQAAARMRGE